MLLRSQFAELRRCFIISMIALTIGLSITFHKFQFIKGKTARALPDGLKTMLEHLRKPFEAIA